MNKAQVKLGLIFLAIVAIIAVIGLILFAKNSITQYGIGDVYGEPGGIVPVTQLPPYEPWGETQYPASIGQQTTIGTTTPIMIFFRGEYSNIAEMSKCWDDLTFKMAAPQDAFNCYVVPTSGPMYPATGFFWPTDSSMPRPTADIGGDINCYEGALFNRQEMFTRLRALLTPLGWTETMVNGLPVMLCNKGARYVYSPQ